MKIKPARRLRGTISLPGDKSISHRAALLSAMSNGTARIENFATSADCASTLACLESLGVSVRRDGASVHIEGVGKNGFAAPDTPLDCGNSGTTMRLLAGILAGQNFDSVLIGDESLSKRPMKRVVEPLTLAGARIEAAGGCAPLRIFGVSPLESKTYAMKVHSAQVKSCVLLAGLNAHGVTKVQSPKSEMRVATSRNHTELMLEYLGAYVEEKFIEAEDGGFVHEVSIDGDSILTARDLVVPSDISSAAFFLVAASCLNDSDLVLKNVGLNPTRRAIVDVLQALGAQIEVMNEAKICNETTGDLRVAGAQKVRAKSQTNIIEGDVIANLIDEIPILAVFGTQIEGGLEIRGAHELRVKESDRIKSVVNNLRRMNADVEEFADGLRVGKSDLKGALIDSYNDHRIAMAFAVAGLLAQGATEIKDAECTGVSFPDFFRTLAEVVE